MNADAPVAARFVSVSAGLHVTYGVTSAGTPRGTLLLFGALVALSLAACHTEAIESSRVPAGEVVSDLNTSVPLVAPDTVTTGTPFVVSFATVEGGCHTADSVNATVVGNVATITPYDAFIGGPMVACPDDLIPDDPRSATVQFQQPGSGTVTVQGASAMVGPGTPVTWVVLTRSVIVRP